MTFIVIYLVKLFIAPQHWVAFFLNWRVDFYLYPVWMLSFLVNGKAKRLLPLTPFDIALLCWVLWTVLTCLINEENEHTWRYIREYPTWFIMFKLVSAYLDTLRRIQWAAFWLVAVCFVIVIEGIQHKLSPDGLGWAGQELGWVVREVIEAGGSGRTRWVAIFDGPGVFAVIYTSALPFLLPLTAKPYGFFVRLVALALSGAFMLAIYYTGSRGGMLATIGIVGLYLMYHWNVSLTRVLMVCGLVSVIFALAPAHLTSTSDSSRSAQYRVETWADGANMAQENPFFGVGPGNYADSTVQRLVAHNSAIEVLGTTGFFGLFLWFTMLYLGIKNLVAYHGTLERPQDRSFVAMIGISLIGYLISSIFVTLEYETMYFILALCAAAGKLLPAPVPISLKECGFIMLAVFGLFFWIKIFSEIYF